MSTDKALNDATSSSKGTIYQLCVAVQKCYEMLSGQKMLIEVDGDVTIDEQQQIETKHYGAPLTDGHKNLWNTLNNWLQTSFDDASYASLVLFTTQQFGEKATITAWNESTIDEKITLLTSIKSKFETEYQERVATDTKARPSEVLLLQRFVLDPSRRDKLSRVVGKFVIEASSPTLPALHKTIKERHIKGIPNGNKDDFLYALLGFIAQPQAEKLQRWEITYEQFDTKVGGLLTAYCRETRTFPGKFFDRENLPASSEVAKHHAHNFVLKIKEIEHHAVITEAIHDYIGAVQTFKEEFAKYEVGPQRSERYAFEIIKAFEKHHRIASSKCQNVNQDSQNFYDERTSERPWDFEGFNQTPSGFRNGVIHIQMDDSSKELKWRLAPP